MQWRLTHSIREVVDGVTNNAVTAISAGLYQRVDNDFGDLMSHACSLSIGKFQWAGVHYALARLTSRSIAGRKLSARAAFHQEA